MDVMAKHYSVRRSVQDTRKYKIVLAGGWGGYSDIDLPLFDTLEEALSTAERMNSLKQREL